MDAPVWTSRQRMGFPRADPEVHYCLPLFLHHQDSRAFWLAGGDGLPLPCSRDPVHEAEDHDLLWLDKPPHELVFFFSSPDANLFAGREASSKTPEEMEASRRLELLEPEAVLPLADFFRGGAQAVLDRWELRAENAEAANYVSTRPLQDEAGIGLPACGAAGELLDLDTARGFLGLVRKGRQSEYGKNGSITVRVHFFDDGQDHTALGHWLGFKSWRGTAAIGLAFGIDGCYSTLTGRVPTGKQGEHYGWLRTAVDRTRGWHVFELLLEAGQIHFSIDNEPVASTPAAGTDAEEEVSLVSRCGGHGLWAGLEVFHTPRGQQAWEVGLQSMQPGERRPWTALSETGRWQVDDKGVMQNVSFMEGAVAQVTTVRQQLVDSFSLVPEKYQYRPGMDSMLGRQFRVLTVNSDGMVGLPSPEGSEEPVWWFPPVAAALVVATELVPELLEHPTAEPAAPPSPAAAALELPARAVERQAVEEEEEEQDPTPREARPGVGGLAIECWTVAGEEDISRMERVMTTFVAALEAANVAMPGNIHRIEQCRAPQHASCFVYSFGTRRMHVATRATENGRLLLVVRCGGGFIDFVEFARRHGSLERMRVERNNQLRSSGGVVRLTSVLSRGKVRVQQGRSPVVARQGSRPPSRATSQQASSPSSGNRSPSLRAAGA